MDKNVDLKINVKYVKKKTKKNKNFFDVIDHSFKLLLLCCPAVCHRTEV